MQHLLLVGMIFAFGVESFLWKLNKRSPMATLLILSFWALVVALPAFIIAWAIPSVDLFANLTWGVVGWIALANVFIIICILSWVRVMQFMHVSIADPLSLFRIIPLVFLSFWIFGDPLTVWQVIAVAVIFIMCGALGFVQGRKNTAKESITTDCECEPECIDVAEGAPQQKAAVRSDFLKGMLFMAIWLVSAVTLDMLVRHIMDHEISIFAQTTISRTIKLVAVVPLFWIKRQSIHRAIREGITDKLLIIISCLAYLGVLALLTLITTMNVGVFFAIATPIMSVLTILLGVILLKERARWYSYILIAGIIAGAVTLAVLGM